jgi:hypothetical protein
LLRTKETVVRETPALRATSWLVTRFELTCRPPVQIMISPTVKIIEKIRAAHEPKPPY